MKFIKFLNNKVFHSLRTIENNQKIYISSLIFISLLIKFFLLIGYDIPQPPDARKHINILDYLFDKVGFIADVKYSVEIIFIAPYLKIQPLLLFYMGTFITTILQIVVSSIGILLIFNIAKIITKNVHVASISALLFCFNPFITYYSLLFQYETLFIFFLLSSMNLFLIKKKIASYFLFIFTILINPVAEFGIPVFIILTSIFIFKFSIIQSFKNLSMYIVIYIIMQITMISYNYKEFGTFVRYYQSGIISLEYNEAYAKYGLDFEKIRKFNENIALKACPKDSNFSNDIFYLLTKHRACTQKVLNKYSYDYLLNTDNTLQIMNDMLSRVGRLFSLYPYDTKETHVKIISTIYYSFLYFFLIIFFLQKKYLSNKQFYPIIFFTVLSLSVYIVLHAVFRYRVPYDTFLIILASKVINDIIIKINKKTHN